MIQSIKKEEKAPAFTLQSDDEKDVSLSGYRGKKLVLYFYPKYGAVDAHRKLSNLEIWLKNSRRGTSLFWV